MFQSLSSDVATHHAQLTQLLDLSQRLRNLVNIEDPKDQYSEALDVIMKLQENIESSLRRLLAFKNNWNKQEEMTYQLEEWMTRAEKELAVLCNSEICMGEFWVSALLILA